MIGRFDTQARRPSISWPWGERLPFERRVVCADLALAATFCAVLALFAISPVTLEGMGIPYMTAGGGIFAKVHPATPLAGCALALRCLASRHPLSAAWRVATADAGALLLLCAFAVMVAYATLVAHTPFTPLIDTFALPVLMFLLLRDLDPKILRALAVIVLVVFCANAVIALGEFIGQRHLVTIPVPAGVSSDPTRGDVTFDWRAELANDWRATALLGHPLTNGLATGALILCLVAGGASWLPTLIKAPIVLLQAVAMLAFGARTALVLTIVMSLWLGIAQLLRGLREGRRLEPQHLAFALVTIATAFLVVGLFAQTSLVEHMLDRFQNDQGSASTRITMLHLFDPLSWSDILLGPDPEQVATQQRLEGLEYGIESSWIGLALTYGLAVTAMTLTALAAFTRSLMKATGSGTGLIALFFVIQVSTAASLSTKTTILAMTSSLLLILLHNDEDVDVYRRTSPGAA